MIVSENRIVQLSLISLFCMSLHGADESHNKLSEALKVLKSPQMTIENLTEEFGALVLQKPDFYWNDKELAVIRETCQSQLQQFEKAAQIGNYSSYRSNFASYHDEISHAQSSFILNFLLRQSYSSLDTGALAPLVAAMQEKKINMPLLAWLVRHGADVQTQVIRENKGTHTQENTTLLTLALDPEQAPLSAVEGLFMNDRRIIPYPYELIESVLQQGFINHYQHNLLLLLTRYCVTGYEPNEFIPGARSNAFLPLAQLFLQHKEQLKITDQHIGNMIEEIHDVNPEIAQNLLEIPELTYCREKLLARFKYIAQNAPQARVAYLRRVVEVEENAQGLPELPGEFLRGLAADPKDGAESMEIDNAIDYSYHNPISRLNELCDMEEKRQLTKDEKAELEMLLDALQL